MNTRTRTGNKASKPTGKNTTMSDTSNGCAAISTEAVSSPDLDHASIALATPVTPSNSDLAALITGMKTSVESNNEQLNSKLDTIISDISGIKKSVKELQDFATDTSKRIDDIENARIPDMLKKLEKVKDDLEEKLTLFELHERKLNLLIYGIKKSANENVYDECFSTFATLLNISADEAKRTIPLINAHRLPRRIPAGNAAATHQPEPIIVRFGRMQDRDRILHAFQHRPRPASAAAAANPITIRTDLPPGMKRERGRLASIAYNLRKERENLSTRIIVMGTQVVLQTRTNSSSNRPLSAWSTWQETPQ